MAIDIPHFAFPFRYGGGRALLVEQGSEQEIQGNVELVLSTVIGQRETQPDFGIVDQTFVQNDRMVADMIAAAQHWEPRADIDTVVAVANNMRTVTVQTRVAG